LCDGGTIIDKISHAPTLRPKVLVEFEGGKGSTSRISLLAPNGKRYVIVADHGFPIGDLNVYYPICGKD